MDRAITDGAEEGFITLIAGPKRVTRSRRGWPQHRRDDRCGRVGPGS